MKLLVVDRGCTVKLKAVVELELFVEFDSPASIGPSAAVVVTLCVESVTVEEVATDDSVPVSVVNDCVVV